MNTRSIVLIALALAMDAFAVSIASGVAIKNLKLHHALTIALWFGLFQALMPLMGWMGGTRLTSLVGDIDHWIACVLLCFIGGKMIYEAFKIEDVADKTDPLDVSVLFVLSLATSIDALATGVSFAMLGVAIITPALIIGLVTFCMCFFGVLLGDKVGHFFEKKMEVFAGLLLIAIGIKLLFSHL